MKLNGELLNKSDGEMLQIFSIGEKVHFVKNGKICNGKIVGMIKRNGDLVAKVDDTTKFEEEVPFNNLIVGHARLGTVRKINDFWSCFASPFHY